MLVQTDEYFVWLVCTNHHWLKNIKLEDAAALVKVPLKSDEQRLNYHQKLASGECKYKNKSEFTSAVAADVTRTI